MQGQLVTMTFARFDDVEHGEESSKVSWPQEERPFILLRDIHPGLKTEVDVNAGKTEIRPGLSNVLYLMRRLAPSLPFGQMAKMMHTAS
jgi:hypothetical protein